MSVPAEKQRNLRVEDGMLVINKPQGMVSKDVSRVLQKKIAPKTKLGHVGTLDPIAEGVLPILFGKATRLQDYLLELDKEYEFDVRFGVLTTTLDTEGEIVSSFPFEHIDSEKIRSVIQDFLGEFNQVPPIYSAVKYKGKPLYKYAREGKESEVPLEDLAKMVTVKKLEFLRFSKDTATFRVTCSKGTYVRSLADSISQKLGTRGIISRLVRLSAAGVKLDGAITVGSAESVDDLNSFVVPIEEFVLPIPSWKITSDFVLVKLKLGQKVKVDLREFESGLVNGLGEIQHGTNPILLLNQEGRALGLGETRFSNDARVIVSMRRLLL